MLVQNRNISRTFQAIAPLGRVGCDDVLEPRGAVHLRPTSWKQRTNRFARQTFWNGHSFPTQRKSASSRLAGFSRCRVYRQLPGCSNRTEDDQNGREADVGEEAVERQQWADSVEKQHIAGAESSAFWMARAPFWSGFSRLLRCGKDLGQFAEVLGGGGE